MPTPSQRLTELGLTLPVVEPPVAAYLPALRSGSFVFTSGQVPILDGALVASGKVGAEVDAEEAYACARACALNALAAIDALVGLDSVVRVVKVVAFIASDPSFTGQPQVANGASELLGEIFGSAHARSAVGVAALPLDSPVEVELIVEVAG